MLTLALVARLPVVVPFAVLLLAIQYIAILAFEADALDTRAPVIAALLLAVAELAYWSVEQRGTIADEPGTHLRRLALLAGLLLAAVAAGTVLLALVEQISARGPAVDVLGALAAVGAIALLALAAASRGSGRKGHAGL